MQKTENEFCVIFKNVGLTLGKTRILDNVSASIPFGVCTAIIGPNGAGKTSLLQCMLGLIPYEGEIILNSRRSSGKIRVGYIPQKLNFDRGLPITLLEFLCMGIQKIPFFFKISKKSKEKAMELLSMVGLAHISERKVGVLSGGEFQRLLLALALSQDPELLVLDEPAAGVDIQGEQLFCELLEKLRAEKKFTQLMVSHDLPTVTHHANHLICLNRRVEAEGHPKDVLTKTNLISLFGIHMGLVDGKAMPDGKTECSAKCCSPPRL